MTTTPLFTFDLGAIVRWCAVGIAALIVLKIALSLFKAYRARKMAQEQELTQRVREALERQLKVDIPSPNQGS